MIAAARTFHLFPYLIALLGGVTIIYAAQDFHIDSVRTYRIENQYFLNATVQYRFNPQALDALDNGVPLTLQIQIQVRRNDAWIWEESLADLQLYYQIRYKPLSKAYLITNLADQTQRSYISRDAAINALGELTDVPLLTQNRLNTRRDYTVQVRVSLDIEALPLPLRPMAYLHPTWQQTSEWTRWPLTP
ncbi:DUF4390 domain-containing protein [Thiospirillum jenense]|uniref:DUF4390 domain-containing protein n=1 Tax=Thiospirillum jenense TaxID=1653858 RepID=A0A839H8E4_9GAMM|nr:DUF4390 domain-containing protein [Thiospirillum jenense]MBB1125411.1 DUF4390 domain-containing protein [Thiospirillum jenense]